MMLFSLSYTETSIFTSLALLSVTFTSVTVGILLTVKFVSAVEPFSVLLPS